MSRISRQAYADMFGPTVGDRVRLADTALWVEVEKDFTVYGEEVKFGGGKVIRDGMGQGQMLAAEAMDLVLTNALIIDHWGIVKADIGVRHGRIAAIGKAGNPDVQPGVTVPVGPGTEVIAAEGKIITAGGIDSHIHFICPQQVEEALISGVTTFIGAAPGRPPAPMPPPARPALVLGAHAPGRRQPADQHRLVGQRQRFAARSLAGADRRRSGGPETARRLGLHAGCHRLLPGRGRGAGHPVAIHTDTLNESGCIEDTLAAIGDRTIHTFHTEGAGAVMRRTSSAQPGRPMYCPLRPTRRCPIP